MHRLDKHKLILLLVLVAAVCSLGFPKARAAVTVSEPVVYLLSTPDPLTFDVQRGESTQRGAHAAVPTPEPTPRAKPVIATPTPTPKPVTLARPASAHVLAWPVHGHINTYFSSAHPAIDIGAPLGTLVRAACSGRVIYAGWKNNGGGNVVDIACDNGLIVSNNHLSAILAVKGVAVSVGARVALVGMTGHATGPHLHFAVIKNGYFVNPLAYL